jgi:hypothetical protein
MGQCIDVAEREDGPTTREMPSEMWMHPDAAGDELAKGHLLNTTVGVWCYESDLWDKQSLRRRHGGRPGIVVAGLQPATQK